MAWDQLLVWLIVAAAVAYVARSVWVRRKKPGCGGCDANCGPKPASRPAEPAPLIQLELTPRGTGGRETPPCEAKTAAST